MDVMTTATTWRKTMREMIDLKRSTSFFLGNEVADAANRMNLNPGAALGQLLAQAMNIDLDRVRRDLAGMPENMILDLLLGDHASLAAHQQLQHCGFARREHLRLIVDRGLPVLGVELEVGD